MWEPQVSHAVPEYMQTSLIHMHYRANHLAQRLRLVQLLVQRIGQRPRVGNFSKCDTKEANRQSRSSERLTHVYGAIYEGGLKGGMPASLVLCALSAMPCWHASLTNKVLFQMPPSRLVTYHVQQSRQLTRHGIAEGARGLEVATSCRPASTDSAGTAWRSKTSSGQCRYSGSWGAGGAHRWGRMSRCRTGDPMTWRAAYPPLMFVPTSPCRAAPLASLSRQPRSSLSRPSSKATGAV